MESTAHIKPLPETGIRKPFSVPLKAAMRAITLVILVVTLIPWLVGQPFLYQAMLTPCEPDCDTTELTSADLAAFKAHNVSVEFYAAIVISVGFLVIIAFTLCCLLLLWKLSDNWTGWVATLIFAGSTAIPVGLDYGMEHLALPVMMYRVGGSIFATYFIIFLYIFPSGQFYPRALKWPILILLAIRFLSGADTVQYEERSLWYVVGAYVWLILFALGAVSQIFRYRRASSEVERLQTRWVIFSLFVMVLGMLVSVSTIEWWGTKPGAPRGFILLMGYPFLMLTALPFPIAITFAILRYKLWNIDLIINRTLVYGILTALVLGIYVAVVGGLGALFNATDNPTFALIATGMVALSFQSLHHRVQRAVNRLMFGQRDDPYAVLSRLGQRLEAAIAPDAALTTIVETVAQALKLPAVAIEIQADGGVRTIARRGRLTHEWVRFPLTYQAEIIGQLAVAPRSPGETFSPADLSLLENIARQTGAALHAAQLTDALQRSRQRLVTTREEERRRLRRDLHDGLGPTLAAHSLKIGSARELYPHDPATADQLLAELETDTQRALDDIRRLVYNLRPPALDQLGLVGAIRDFTTVYRVKGLHIQVAAPEQMPPLPAAVEVAAYRIVQEAVHNVARHAHARQCRIEVQLDDRLHVSVVDNGVGLPPKPRGGVGLTSMRERAEELGGVWIIEPAPDGGTRVYAALPLPEEQLWNESVS